MQKCFPIPTKSMRNLLFSYLNLGVAVPYLSLLVAVGLVEVGIKRM